MSQRQSDHHLNPCHSCSNACPSQGLTAEYMTILRGSPRRWAREKLLRMASSRIPEGQEECLDAPSPPEKVPPNPQTPHLTPCQLGLFCCSGWAHMCPDIQSGDL